MNIPTAMLSFHPSMVEKIVEGSKRQTIRRNVQYWADKAGYRLYLWCGMPYRGGYKFAVGTVIDVERKLGSEITQYDAVADGFADYNELRKFLVEVGGLYDDEFDQTEWAIIRFSIEEWVKCQKRKKKRKQRST